ncbi:10017_t:CDS:2 [Acaulospora morrowiae]|uniref:10017_t:CDS:1 n=1 Tax=Acaulospora morrowiae TaxID=94023 RepID=A0A9N9FCX3_9GLOM|nr:10017_t:CDS:2 [Acaulospora morrowiae]
MSSLTRLNALPSSLTLSSFPLKNIEVHIIDDEEYVSLLTFHQRSLENLESDLEDEEENTTSVHRDRHRATVQLPPPPYNFDYFIHLRPLHCAFVNLLPQYKANFSKPINLFLLFFMNNILDTIVANMNLYSLSKNADGLFNSPSLNQYWNENTKLPIHNISKQMLLFHFEQIKRYLHVSSPIAIINNYFEKLEPLLSKIRDVSKQLYTPSSNVSVDEMIVRFSGRSVYMVRIKNKPTPKSFKILSLCKSGYIYIFLPILHISSSGVPKVNGLNQVGCLVYHLVMQLPYYQSSFNVYMDNYFSNVPLFQNLRQLGIGTCGTVCKTALGFLKELRIEKNVKLDWNIRSGVIVNSVLLVF